MFDTTLSFNVHGEQASAGTLRLFASHITNNTTNGINLAGGSVFSHQNNAIQANADNQAPTMGIGTQ